MLKVELGEKQYGLPQTWDEITLKQFKEVMLIDNSQDELSYKIELLSILLNCYVEELEQCSLNSLNSLYNQIDILLREQPKELFSSILKINGKEYYFDNNLDANTTTGMLIDVTNLMKKGNFWDNAEQILAVYIRPIEKKKKDYRYWKGFKKENYPDLVNVQKYNFEQRTKTAEDLLQAPMSFIFPCSVFFWTLSKELSQSIINSFMMKK